MAKHVTPELFRALKSIDNLGAPGSGKKFLDALDALEKSWPKPPADTRPLCPKCGYACHAATLKKYSDRCGTCYRAGR